ncbi:hypothetical protein [Granulicella paludicola]|uniref:hypothetical protein n=1 Tax=Granulicella paludicola TaxID=474951 RepID=UPI0021E0DAB1|nr:hypothetical protein [Granulicella paludicola]
MEDSKRVSATPHEKFTEALASVLSASPEQIRDMKIQAKAEKPSPHTRYTYDPAEAES